MNALTVLEDPQKLKKQSIMNLIISLVLIIIGVVIFSRPTPDYITAALVGSIGGAFIGGGGMLLFMAVKGIARAGKTPMTILSSDLKGVTVFLIRDAKVTIPWQDIQAVVTAKKGVRQGVAVMLKQPDEFLNSLSKKEKQIAKSNKQIFGSPIFVSTSTCLETKEEIVAELNKCMQSCQ